MNLMTSKERKMEGIYEAISSSEQRSEEWYAQRLGKFTASRFGDLMTNGRKKDEVLGATAVSYIYEKAAEILTGRTKGNLRDCAGLGKRIRANLQGLLLRTQRRNH